MVSQFLLIGYKLIK